MLPQTMQSNVRLGNIRPGQHSEQTFNPFIVNRPLESVFFNELLQKVNLTYL